MGLGLGGGEGGEEAALRIHMMREEYRKRGKALNVSCLTHLCQTLVPLDLKLALFI